MAQCEGALISMYYLDGLALALLTKAPIFVAPEVLEANQYLLTTNAVIQRLDEIRQKSVQVEEIEMEWRSFRSLPQGSTGMK